jgi:transposase
MPVVTATALRLSLNMLSAVSLKDQFRFMLHEGTIPAPVFKSFLQRLLVGATNPVFAMVDGLQGAQVQAGTELRREPRQQTASVLPVAALSPYEQVWAHVKRHVSNQRRHESAGFGRSASHPETTKNDQVISHDNECLYARMQYHLKNSAPKKQISYECKPQNHFLTKRNARGKLYRTLSYFTLLS